MESIIKLIVVAAAVCLVLAVGYYITIGIVAVHFLEKLW
jgi:hypothetical protein